MSEKKIMRPTWAGKEPWHVDRRIPAALILAIFVQTVGIVWWAATTQSKIDTALLAISSNKNSIMIVNDKGQDVRDKVISLERAFVSLEKSVDIQTLVLKDLLLELRKDK